MDWKEHLLIVLNGSALVHQKDEAAVSSRLDSIDPQLSLKYAFQGRATTDPEKSYLKMNLSIEGPSHEKTSEIADAIGSDLIGKEIMGRKHVSPRKISVERRSRNGIPAVRVRYLIKFILNPETDINEMQAAIDNYYEPFQQHVNNVLKKHGLI